MKSEPFDWAAYRMGGALRADSFSGMQGDFRSSLERMFADAPPEIQAELRVNSGYRSPERQAELWADALEKYGSAAEARKWVAPPGNSQHNKGNAADLKYLSPEAKAWVHANAPKYGLAFPLANEPWHVELATARGGAPAEQEFSAGYEPAGTPSASLIPGTEPDPDVAPEDEEDDRAKLFADLSSSFASRPSALDGFSDSLSQQRPTFAPYQPAFGKFSL